jgi:hypothetical protein
MTRNETSRPPAPSGRRLAAGQPLQDPAHWNWDCRASQDIARVRLEPRGVKIEGHAPTGHAPPHGDAAIPNAFRRSRRQRDAKAGRSSRQPVTRRNRNGNREPQPPPPTRMGQEASATDERPAHAARTVGKLLDPVMFYRMRGIRQVGEPAGSVRGERSSSLWHLVVMAAERAI